MNVPRLSRQMLASLPQAVGRPGFDPSRVATGIGHLGLGAFARAHLASYTDPLLETDPSWGICGVSLRSAATRNALAPQDWLYLRAERDGAGENLRAMGALTGALLAPEDPAAVIRRFADLSVRVVTISVSEKGYYRRAADGALDEADPAIQRDLVHPDAPSTMPGIIVAALRARRDRGIPPFTVLCCDNLPENGVSTRRIVLHFADLLSPELANYIARAVAFPNSMVDRIVPATTEADKQRVATIAGVADAWPVVCEPFTQWVIEDHFPLGRPQWEHAGAEIVSDVRPYEMMKLRLLNSSHSAIAYLGQLAGWTTVTEAMREPPLADFIAALMAEAATTLRMPQGVNLALYQRALINRFRNPALQHQTTQIAMDGSQKLPMRILATAQDRLTNGLRAPCMAFVTAAWLQFLRQRSDSGSSLTVDDPNKEKLLKAASNAGTHLSLVKSIFAMADIVPAVLAASDVFASEVIDALTTLSEIGVHQALIKFNHREGIHEYHEKTTDGLLAGRIVAGPGTGASCARQKRAG